MKCFYSALRKFSCPLCREEIDPSKPQQVSESGTLQNKRVVLIISVAHYAEDDHHLLYTMEALLGSTFSLCTFHNNYYYYKALVFSIATACLHEIIQLENITHIKFIHATEVTHCGLKQAISVSSVYIQNLFSLLDTMLWSSFSTIEVARRTSRNSRWYVNVKKKSPSLILRYALFI